MPFLDSIQGFKNTFIQNDIQSFGKREPTIVYQGLKGARIVEKFDILDKGCNMYIIGEKYPMRGHVRSECVEEITKIKRNIPMIVHFLSGINGGRESEVFKKKNIFTRIFLAISFFWWKEFFINWMHWSLTDALPDSPDRYNQPVREVYRVVKDYRVRDIFCFILEYDMAYRYIFQDIIFEMNKDDVIKNPIKEFKRLSDLLMSRSGEIPRFRAILKVAINYLRFDRKLLKEVVNFCKEINIDEVKSSIEDMYWQNQRMYSYNFRGILIEERVKIYEEEKYEYQRRNNIQYNNTIG